MKLIGCGKPDVTGSGERLSQGFQHPRLGEIGRPGLEVGLGCEPFLERRVSVGRGGRRCCDQAQGQGRR